MLTAISQRESDIVRREIQMFHVGHQIQNEAASIIAECLDIPNEQAFDLCNRHLTDSTVLDELHVEVFPNDPDSPQERAWNARETEQQWRDLEMGGVLALICILLAACLIWLGYWLAG